MITDLCFAVRTQLELVELRGVDLLRSVFQIRHGLVFERGFSMNGERQTTSVAAAADHMTLPVGAEFLGNPETRRPAGPILNV